MLNLRRCAVERLRGDGIFADSMALGSSAASSSILADFSSDLSVHDVASVDMGPGEGDEA